MKNQFNNWGLRIGYWEEYSPKIDLTTKGYYTNGVRDGYWESSIGKSYYHGNYLNGEKDGYFIQFNENTKLITKTYFI